MLIKNKNDLTRLGNLDAKNYFYLVAKGTEYLYRVRGNTHIDRNYLRFSFFILKDASDIYPEKDKAHIRKQNAIYTDKSYGNDFIKKKEIYDTLFLSHHYHPKNLKIEKNNLNLLINELKDFGNAKRFFDSIKEWYVDEEILEFKKGIALISPYLKKVK